MRLTEWKNGEHIKSEVTPYLVGGHQKAQNKDKPWLCDIGHSRRAGLSRRSIRGNFQCAVNYIKVYHALLLFIRAPFVHSSQDIALTKHTLTLNPYPIHFLCYSSA